MTICKLQYIIHVDSSHLISTSSGVLAVVVAAVVVITAEKSTLH